MHRSNWLCRPNLLHDPSDVAFDSRTREGNDHPDVRAWSRRREAAFCQGFEDRHRSSKRVAFSWPVCDHIRESKF